MKILRLTQHAAETSQMNALFSLFGSDADIQQVSVTLSGSLAEQVAQFDSLASEYDVVEAVLPITLLEALFRQSSYIKSGKPLIRAVMDRSIDENGKVSFSFKHYEQIFDVRVVTLPILPKESAN